MHKTLPFILVLFVTCIGPEAGVSELQISSGEPILVAPCDTEYSLRGTVVDENGRPVGDARLFAWFRSVSASGWSQLCLPPFVETNVDGRFQTPFARTVKPGASLVSSANGILLVGGYEPGTRRCFFMQSWDGSAETDLVDLSRQLEPGWHFLGELVLAPLGDEMLLARLSDHALMNRYQKMAVFEEDMRRWQACLGEMARRGGTWWQAYLAKELSMRDEMRSNFSLLTALRHAERLPDPLIVEIDGPAAVSREFRCTRDQLPTLHVRLRNQDPKGTAVRLRSNWGFSLFPQVLGPNVLKVRKEPGIGVMTPLGSIVTISHGDRGVTATINLQDYVQICSPGRYQLCVVYHDDPDAVPLSWGGELRTRLENTKGFICASSKPVTLIVTK